jgi:hypothetical protein
LQVGEPPALEVRVSSRPTNLIQMSEQVRRPGRPRKWSSEADRKRAYRQRRAAELAVPLELREAARAARSEAADSRSAVEAAQREGERWRAKTAAAERRAGAAERKLALEKARAQRLIAERDEARRLLRRKLQWARHAEGLRRDPDALLALVAELDPELEKLRKEVSKLRLQGR